MALNGIDVSGFQPANITSLVDYDFVIIKATEGTGYVSKSCDAQYQGAVKRGKLAGVYHFASVGDPVAQADYFLAQVGGYVGHAMLVLDWEGPAIAQGPGWAKTWLDRVYTRTGVRPVIYMSASVVNEFDWSAVHAANYGLWVASYGSDAITGPRTPAAPSVRFWGTPALFQYGSQGRLPGYGANLDVDVFYGDAKAWAAYAAKNGKPAAPVAPAAPAAVHVSSGLAEDGLLGPATVRRMQHDLGTPEDGVLSHPSAMVMALQRRLNAQGFRDWDGKALVVDGLGLVQDGSKTRTIYAFQRYLGVPADGILSHPSGAVRALQHRLNTGHI